MSTLSVKVLIRLTTHILNHDPDMTVSRLQVFLLVVGKKDVLVRDLVKQTGLNQSTIARTLALLSNKPQRGKKEGLGWVRIDPDPEDPRRVVVNPTARGIKVMTEIEALA